MAFVISTWSRSAMKSGRLHPIPAMAPKPEQSSSMRALKVMGMAEKIRESGPLLLDYSSLLNFN